MIEPQMAAVLARLERRLGTHAHGSILLSERNPVRSALACSPTARVAAEGPPDCLRSIKTRLHLKTMMERIWNNG